MTETQDARTDTRTVAFLVASEGIERVELTEPWGAVSGAGHTPILVSTDSGEVGLVDHLDPAGAHAVDRISADTSAADIDVLVLPGGVANPDALRQDSHAVNLVREMVDAGKPVFAICHAPWMLVEADVVRGRRITSYPSLRTDLVNAGAEWVDAELVSDGGITTSRRPDDLPAFCDALLEALRGDA
ncbi:MULTISPECIES: type 1 glutamine amidotransferase domain-containing protein [Dietzia]|uniref:Type 1 glutamine amidotransferase n=1 Tax=Dietzia cinnamea TaxID=321318 RepID=A0AAW5Q9Z4_9ACTN|nr:MULTISPECIES: type 1 glutamine amidotransferase domain-containing protein [Dietzia]PWD97222.1 type 1 glutamine amidotransferase [Dietzia maris]AVM65760.1 type 1 glutamine amidotransferase [Dietzia sp. oral taxon 368]MBM7230893.1 type 1 glutamine amidotransferase [Dietzia cinnamea]MCT1864752.1 type 1 glutamine amidotransferase [Dietzia cinnamea]MCT1885670.1 type 1 glutamine amidotransferase [Dietzia cinnamea]